MDDKKTAPLPFRPIAVYFLQKNKGGGVINSEFFKPSYGVMQNQDVHIAAYQFMERCKMSIGNTIIIRMIELTAEPKF